MPTTESLKPSTRRMVDRVSVEEFYHATLNGDVVSYAWFSWLPRGQSIGHRTLEETKEYIKEITPYMPKHMKAKWGARKVFYVCIDKEPAGSMFNFGPGSITGKKSSTRKRCLPFPKRMDPQHGGFKTREVAEEVKREFIAYIEDVCSVDPKYRAGSSKFW